MRAQAGWLAACLPGKAAWQGIEAAGARKVGRGACDVTSTPEPYDTPESPKRPRSLLVTAAILACSFCVSQYCFALAVLYVSQSLPGAPMLTFAASLGSVRSTSCAARMRHEAYAS